MASEAPTKTIALITGANQGLGFEIAKKLGTEHPSYHIIATGRRQDAIDSAVAKLTALGISAEPLVLDVTSDASIAAAVSSVQSRHGHLDVLINNAGISRRIPGQPATAHHADWATILDTNVAGVALVMDAFIPLLERSQTTKRVVNMTSTLGSFGKKQDLDNPFRMAGDPWMVYSVSKAALNFLTLSYAARYEGDKSWKFNVTCPGLCSTNLNGYIEGGEDPEMGAINAVRLASRVGEGEETGTFTNRHGVVPW